MIHRLENITHGIISFSCDYQQDNMFQSSSSQQETLANALLPAQVYFQDTESLFLCTLLLCF